MKQYIPAECDDNKNLFESLVGKSTVADLITEVTGDKVEAMQVLALFDFPW